MRTEILLHTEAIDVETAARLAEKDIIAIKVESLEGVRFLTGEARSVELNGMLWAALEAIGAEDSYSSTVAKKFVKSLAVLAREAREREKSREEAAARGEQQ